MSEVDKELAAIGYPQHILDGFSNGALLDLRMRFAMNLLTNSPMFQLPAPGKDNAQTTAGMALDIADALFAEGEKRGYVSQLTHDSPLSKELCEQAQRIGAFEAFKQTGARMAMESLQPAVRPAHPSTRLNG